MSLADLHCHSTASDGRLSPSAVVDLAAANGVRVLALTDHDTLEGIAEATAAAARHSGLTLVPGVELSCEAPDWAGPGEVHMLGLFVDPADAAFQARLAEMRDLRVHRGRHIVERLEALGVPVEWERVLAFAGDASIGRPHVALAMMERGYVDTTDEAFERYLAHGMPAYVARDRTTPAEAVALVRDAGGLAVFAHPHRSPSWERIAASLVDEGLFGLEVYYGSLDELTVATIAGTARALGLAATGGSDFHGLPRDGERQPGELHFPDDAVRAMLEAARANGHAVEIRGE